MITVACVNWKNYLGLGAEYVGKLERAVARNLTVPYRFRCLTEADLGTDLEGWWIKLKLFEPGRFTGDVLYLDLDVVLTGNIDGMVRLLDRDRTKLWMRDDFSYSLRNPKGGLDEPRRRQLGGIGCCNSSIMLWHGDACRKVWDRFGRARRDVPRSSSRARPTPRSATPPAWARSWTTIPRPRWSSWTALSSRAPRGRRPAPSPSPSPARAAPRSRWPTPPRTGRLWPGPTTTPPRAR